MDRILYIRGFILNKQVFYGRTRYLIDNLHLLRIRHNNHKKIQNNVYKSNEKIWEPGFNNDWKVKRASQPNKVFRAGDG